MTIAELRNLKFGDRVYYKDGTMGVITEITEDDGIRIVWEDGMNLKYPCSLEHPYILLTKPKKKVKKELIMFAEIRDNGIRAITDYRSEQCDTPITITYETEE